MKYVLAYDIGTTGVKTCIIKVDRTMSLVAGESQSYPLYIMPDGGAEQDADDWWNAMCATTHRVIDESGVKACDISGISFCSQAQGLVLVDKSGIPVRRPMSYMDQRAKKQLEKGISHGIKVADANIRKLLVSLAITGAVAGSVKDPVWKYKWVEENEPDNFRRVYKWLDVKDYLICRCTGNFTMTEDSAYGTLLYDTRRRKKRMSEKMCRMFKVNINHFPKIIKSTDIAGFLKADSAKELGLQDGTPVFGGGMDASLIGVGAGCVSTGDTHIYSGTSGWVITVTDRQVVDASAMIAAIVGAQKDRFNYFAEMETAGKCFEWVKDHLAKDEIGMYVKKEHIAESFESKYTSLFDFMTDTIKDVPPGSGGVIFTPWMHGNRCPFEDPLATSMFFGIKLETGKTQLIRAVLEGIFYHLRWMLECQDNKVQTSNPITFAGGGALSDISCQMLSDITGRKIQTVASPQNVGAMGAAAVTAVGLGLIDSIDDVKNYIKPVKTYLPDMENNRKYQKYYQVFKMLYSTNRKIYSMLKEE